MRNILLIGGSTGIEFTVKFIPVIPNSSLLLDDPEPKIIL